MRKYLRVISNVIQESSAYRLNHFLSFLCVAVPLIAINLPLANNLCWHFNNQRLQRVYDDNLLSPFHLARRPHWNNPPLGDNFRYQGRQPLRLLASPYELSALPTISEVRGKPSLLPHRSGNNHPICDFLGEGFLHPLKSPLNPSFSPRCLSRRPLGFSILLSPQPLRLLA